MMQLAELRTLNTFRNAYKVNKILIINQAWSNHGDEAAHKALVRLLANRYPDAEICVLVHVAPGLTEDSYTLFRPEELKHIRYHRINADPWNSRIIRYLWWIPPVLLDVMGPLLSKSLREVKHLLHSADLIVNAPGGVDLGPYRNWANVVRLILSLRSGRPTAIFGISFGPLPDETWKDRCFSRLAKSILKQVRFLSLRDDKSQNNAKTNRIDYVPTADTAFLDGTKSSIPSELMNFLEASYAVFVPNALFKWHPHFQFVPKEKFEKLYKEIIALFLKNGLRVVMLPQLFGSQNDEAYFRELSSSFSDSEITVIPAQYECEVQQAIIRNAAMVVGARYHSVVFSMNNHTPFVALSYEHKIYNLLTMAGLEDLAFNLNTLNNASPEAVCSQIRSVLQNLEAIKARVATGYQVVFDLGQSASEKFFRLFPYDV